jgi:hypothetical protein
MKMNEMPLPHVGAQLLGLARAERGRRLVENQQLRRRMARRPGDLHHLLLGQRQGLDLGARIDRAAREHLIERGPGERAAARLPAHPANDVRQLDRKILEYAQVRAERELLMDEAQPELHRRPRRVVGRETPPQKLDLAAVGGDQAADDLHQRALAGAIAAHQAHDLGRMDGKIDLLDRFGGAERLVHRLHHQKMAGTAVLR